MQVVLVMLRGDGERRSFSIVRDVTVIGRREDCDFRIPLGDISRKHCRLVKQNGVLMIQDLGSSNGTFINNKRIQEAELSPGDSLQLGGVSFVVQIDGVPGDDELVQQSADAEAATIVRSHESSSGEFDPLTALGDSNADSNLPALTESQINRDLLGELGNEAARERNA
jgi:pSer/pThr/pTyr-binding forkhead associated (FHA) protein